MPHPSAVSELLQPLTFNLLWLQAATTTAAWLARQYRLTKAPDKFGRIQKAIPTNEKILTAPTLEGDTPMTPQSRSHCGRPRYLPSTQPC